jgi:dihydroxy-acid dehydratase
VVRDGDPLRIDVPSRRLDLEIPQAQLLERLAAWRPGPAAAGTMGVLAKYARLVRDASQGAVTSS